MWYEFELDVKKSNSWFALSEKGRTYQNKVKDKYLTLKYIAYIDLYIKIKVGLNHYITMGYFQHGFRKRQWNILKVVKKVT